MEYSLLGPTGVKLSRICGYGHLQRCAGCV